MENKMSKRQVITAFITIMIITFTVNTFGESKEFTNPKVTKKGLIFKYENSFAKSVYLKSSFDNWEHRYPFRKVHSYASKMWNGEWELLLPIEEYKFQLKKGTYKYKLLVDGYFVSDPNSQDVITTRASEKISAFTLKEDINYYNQSPISVKDKKHVYKFFYYNPDAKRVSFAANFNNYNPYNLPFQKREDGYWVLEIELLPGKTFYNFVVDGEWIKDPMNPHKVKDYYNRKIVRSMIEVK